MEEKQDCIDRNAFIVSQCNNCDGNCEKVDCDCLNCKSEYRCDMIRDLADFPSADSEEIQIGKWIDCRDGFTYCSVCGEDAPEKITSIGKVSSAGFIIKSKYCPNCGARMENGE